MNKNYLLTMLASLIIYTPANAQPLICPFNDSFYINTPTTAIISALSSDGNVVAKKIDSLNFTASCKKNTSTASGHVYLTVRLNDCNLCTLHILDGPYEMNPSVKFVNCVGDLVFAGMDHDWGSYRYTLKFVDKNSS